MEREMIVATTTELPRRARVIAVEVSLGEVARLIQGYAHQIVPPDAEILAVQASEDGQTVTAAFTHSSYDEVDVHDVPLYSVGLRLVEGLPEGVTDDQDDD